MTKVEVHFITPSPLTCHIYEFGCNSTLDIGMDETFMGLNIIRWWHIGKAAGDVLEIGVCYIHLRKY